MKNDNENFSSVAMLHPIKKVKCIFVCYSEGMELETAPEYLPSRLFVGDIVNLDEYVNPVTHEKINDDRDFIVTRVCYDIVTKIYTHVIEPSE